jgi:hypothetical protein
MQNKAAFGEGGFKAAAMGVELPNQESLFIRLGCIFSVLSLITVAN